MVNQYDFLLRQMTYLCDSLHQCYLRWLQVSGTILSSPGKHSIGEWVNIAQICCVSTVQHLDFPESSRKVTSDVFHESWEAHFHCRIVQGLLSWLEKKSYINAVGLWALWNEWKLRYDGQPHCLLLDRQVTWCRVICLLTSKLFFGIGTWKFTCQQFTHVGLLTLMCRFEVSCF